MSRDWVRWGLGGVARTVGWCCSRCCCCCWPRPARCAQIWERSQMQVGWGRRTRPAQRARRLFGHSFSSNDDEHLPSPTRQNTLSEWLSRPVVCPAQATLELTLASPLPPSPFRTTLNPLLLLTSLPSKATAPPPSFSSPTHTTPARRARPQAALLEKPKRERPP